MTSGGSETSSLTTKHLYLTFNTAGTREISLTFSYSNSTYDPTYSCVKSIEVISADTSTTNLGTIINRKEVI